MAAVNITKVIVNLPNMAFYNRLLWVIIALIVAPLYSNISPAYKSGFAITGVVLAIGLFAWVSIFAWKKPEHLLYGAETHFEKWKEERKQPGEGQTLVSRPRVNEGSEGIVANHYKT